MSWALKELPRVEQWSTPSAGAVHSHHKVRSGVGLMLKRSDSSYCLVAATLLVRIVTSVPVTGSGRRMSSPAGPTIRRS
jgi:hypothetical protein